MPDLQAIIKRHPELERVRSYAKNAAFVERVRSTLSGPHLITKHKADAALLELGTALEESERKLTTVITENLHLSEDLFDEQRRHAGDVRLLREGADAFYSQERKLERTEFRRDALLKEADEYKAKLEEAEAMLRLMFEEADKLPCPPGHDECDGSHYEADSCETCYLADLKARVRGEGEGE